MTSELELIGCFVTELLSMSVAQCERNSVAEASFFIDIVVATELTTNSVVGTEIIGYSVATTKSIMQRNCFNWM